MNNNNNNRCESVYFIALWVPQGGWDDLMAMGWDRVDRGPEAISL